MANVTSLGIGSGLDLESMITKIMAAERAPIDALTTKISTTQSKISLFGTLSAKLESLQSAADTLQFPARLSAVKASSADSTTVGATATYGAAAGTYSVEVTQLASAQKSFTVEYAAGTTFSPGTMNFTVAGTAASVDFNDSGKTSYTLEEVRDKINNANIGVRATVITTDTGGQRMILTGSNTGADNAFSLTSGLTASGGRLALTGANFDTTTAGLARSDAQDGIVKIEGISSKSSTNTFTAIPGVTLTAKQLSAAGPTTVTVESDADKVVSAAQALVTAYNDIATTIKTNSAYDSSTKTAQPLNGDFAARSISTALSNARTTTPTELASASIRTLSELGISIKQNGQLSLDEAKLRSALSKSPADAMAALQAYGKSFGNAVGTLTDSTGVVTKRTTSLNDAIKIYQDNQTKLEARMVTIEKRYRTQFTAMDTLVAQMKSTSGSLSQMFSSSSSG